MTNYQQIYIKGSTGQDPYQRECEERYEIIRPLLDRFTRRFSVIDLGANLGYFTIRLQDELDCFTVGVDRMRGPIKTILQQNQPRNMVWLGQHLSPVELSRLADCEQFDVGLALNVFHHYETGSLKALMAYKRLCRFIILEICPPDGDGKAKYPHTHKAIYEAVTSDPNAELITETASHITGGSPRYIYLIDNGPVGFLSQQSIDAPERCPHRAQCKVWLPVDGNPTIEIAKREVRINKVYDGPFIPGINVWNMILLNYTWPGKGWLQRELEVILEAVPHDDPAPWNYIFNGKLHAIDNGYKILQKKFPCVCLRLFVHGEKGL